MGGFAARFSLLSKVTGQQRGPVSIALLTCWQRLIYVYIFGLL